jgi:hypothetical protein
VVAPVPTRLEQNRYADQAFRTNPAVVVGSPMPSGKPAFDNANEKK